MLFFMSVRRTGCEGFTMRLSEPALSECSRAECQCDTAYVDFGFREKIRSVDGLLHVFA